MYYVQTWNIRVHRCSPISAQQACHAMAVAEKFINEQPDGFCTVHEMNVFGAIQKEIQRSADTS